MKQVQISFTEKQVQQLHSEKEKLGSSVASIVRKSIVDYFQKQEGSI